LGKGSPKNFDYPRWLLFELLVGEAKDRVARSVEVELARVVVLEGDRASVVGPEVGLDYDALSAPEEVNLPAPELDVDLGWREAVAVDEGEEKGLEVGAGAVGCDAVEAVALVLGLADRAAEEVRWEERGAAEVFDGARDGGDGDVVAVGAQEPSSSPSFLIQVGGRGRRLFGRLQGGAAVKVDAALPLAARGARDGDVDGAVDRAQELPEDRSGDVTQDCALPASEHRGHEAPVKAQAAVADGVDATVDAVELTASDTVSYRSRPQARALELLSR
jgi:hypothetical protein